jgi:hypothetical protein
LYILNTCYVEKRSTLIWQFAANSNVFFYVFTFFYIILSMKYMTTNRWSMQKCSLRDNQVLFHMTRQKHTIKIKCKGHPLINVTPSNNLIVVFYLKRLSIILRQLPVKCQSAWWLLKFKDLKSTFLFTFIKGWPLHLIFIVCFCLVMWNSTWL